VHKSDAHGCGAGIAAGERGDVTLFPV